MKKIILFFLCFYFCLNACKDKDILATTEEKKYLTENKTNIDFADTNFGGLSLMSNQDLLDNQVFFTGETHAVAANYDLRLYFLKFFHQKADVKYHILEAGYGLAKILQRYLDTGEESYLNSVYEQLIGTYIYTKDDYNFFKKLREYNLQFPENQRIKLIGLDVEFQHNLSIRYLQSILPKDKEIPPSISNSINKLRQITFAPNLAELRQFATEANAEFTANISAYEAYFGKEYALDFEIITYLLQKKFEAYDGDGSNDQVRFNQIRDEAMYRTFQKIYPTLSKPKFYGQFGWSHALQSEVPKVKWFGTWLNQDKDSFTKGRVLTTMYFYDDCMMRLQNGRIATTTNITNQSLFQDFDTYTISFFRLNRPNSPFTQKLSWFVGNYSGLYAPEKGVTTDFFEYGIYMKNQKAVIGL